MREEALPQKEIVLVGGGHAHVHVLPAFSRRPLPGVRLTLVARDLDTPYSGMLPGHVAGHYGRDAIHVDLQRLCRATGTRLIHGEAVGIDRAAKRVLLRGRPPLAYDILSLDTGITPALDAIDGAAEHALAVKPIARFLEQFDALLARAAQADGPRRIVMVGGGAGGVELLLALRERLLPLGDGFSFALVSAGQILATHNERVQGAFERLLRQRGVALHIGQPVVRMTSETVVLGDGTALPCDAALAVTAARAPGWFAETGLTLDKAGFLAIRPTFQVENDGDVFAVGDCATMTLHPREKAGVFAVRQGPPLARNLRRHAEGAALRAHRPQRYFLSLVSTGDACAIGSRGGLKVEGRWVWRLKDWIDRRWMRMYQEVGAMTPPVALPAAAGTEMRCGGCAAKVGPAELARALARLGAAGPEDVARVPAVPPGAVAVESVDVMRDFLGDPFRLGRIAAFHALNDLHAAGAQPAHALAIVSVPPGPAAAVEETLFAMMAGAREVFDGAGVQVLGGHSGEGPLACGFAVTGHAPEAALRHKGGLQPGDALVLTRPIGSGLLFAADMRARARARWIAAALARMERSQAEAARLLGAHGARAATDISGFGLIGHLGEMLRASHCGAVLDIAAVPLLDGARELAEGGIASTLLPANLAQDGIVAGALTAAQKAVLFDPQTAGPLLAGVPADRVEACIVALHAAGETEAAIIGRVVAGEVRVTIGGGDK
jgi:selenide,water dikinase